MITKQKIVYPTEHELSDLIRSSLRKIILLSSTHLNFVGVDIKGHRFWRGAKTAKEESLPNVAFLRTRLEFIDSYRKKNLPALANEQIATCLTTHVPLTKLTKSGNFEKSRLS